MTIEYVLLLVAMSALVLKVFISAPGQAFKNAGPKLAARVERQIETGGGFTPNDGRKIEWGTKQ